MCKQVNNVRLFYVNMHKMFIFVHARMSLCWFFATYIRAQFPGPYLVHGFRYAIYTRAAAGAIM